MELLVWSLGEVRLYLSLDRDDKPVIGNEYSRTSVARTLMARLPRLFRTRS